MRKTKGASKELVEIVKEDFGEDNSVKFFISKNGFQRIEISDGKGDIWQTLEATSKAKDDTDFDDISVAIMQALFHLLN